MENNVTYPVVIRYDVEDKVYYVGISDNSYATYGDSFEEAINNAKDYISLELFYNKDNVEIPQYKDLKDGEQLVYLDIFLPYHFSKIKQTYKKKTLTIPTWLDILAKEKNINFSSVLQEALKKELGIF